MMRALFAAVIVAVSVSGAHAQQNCPRTPATSAAGSTTCANTAYVKNMIGASNPTALTYTVATLPSPPTTGTIAYVSDGAAGLMVGATVTGGGSTKYLVWYDGAHWVVVADFPQFSTSTVLGNFSGGTLLPSAQSVPSCANDGAHALTNNSASGFNCTPISTGSSTGPTEQKFTSGSGTYTTPANVVWIEVRMVGAGGGGGGVGGTTGPTGSTGGNSTFGTSLLVANGGVGGVGTTSSATAQLGGAGGTASLGAGPFGLASSGSGGGNTAANGKASGAGGASCLGGGAVGVTSGGTGVAGDSGGGGSGAGNANNLVAGGGGAGGCVYAVIVSPSASYSYAVGGVGAGGVGTGTGAATGGAGGAGVVDVIEHYNH